MSKEEQSTRVNMEALSNCQTDASLHDACCYGSCQTTSCEAKQTSSTEVEQSGVVNSMISKETSSIFNHRLRSHFSFFQKTAAGVAALSTPPSSESKRSHEEFDISSPRKKLASNLFQLQDAIDETKKVKKIDLNGEKKIDLNGEKKIDLNGERDALLETPKYQKREIVILIEGQLNVKSLLKTGYLEGVPVKYKKDKVELDGIIKDQGYRCGCSSCNFIEVVSALKFETHAGGTSKNQNNHIYLNSGISLYSLVKKLKNTPLDSLHKIMEENVRVKGSCQNYCIDLDISENGEESQPIETAKLLTDTNVVKCSAQSATEDSHDTIPSCIDLNLPAHRWNSTINPASSITFNLTSSAKEGIKPRSEFLIQSSSITGKSTMLESKSERKRLPSITDGSKDSPSILNARLCTPDPVIQENEQTTHTGVTVSSDLAKEGNINSVSKLSINDSSVAHKSAMIETMSEKRKRLLSSSNFRDPDGNSMRRLSAARSGPSRKRTIDMHKIIFTELQDGAELFYISNRKEFLKGYKRENGILCCCCGEVVSPSIFEAHAGFSSKRQPYRGIHTSSGISLHDLSVCLSKPKGLTSVCMQCGGGGELVSCTGCSKAFHADCLKVPSMPEPNSELQCLSCKDMNHKIESRRASSILSQVASKPVKPDLKRGAELPKDIGCALWD